MRRSVVLTASVASGVLLWVASPAFGLGWVAWVALVPVGAVSLATLGTRLGRLAVPLAVCVYLELLLVPAFPFGLAEDQWGEPVVPVLVAGSPAVVLALAAIPLFGALLYLVGFPQPVLARGPWLVLVPAVSWTAVDLLRTKFDPSGFWGPVFLSQAETEAAGLAALAGPWLLTFAIVAVNYALALAALDGRRVAPAIAVAAVFLVPAVAANEADGTRAVAVAAVQPGYDTAEFDLPVNRHLRRPHRDLEQASIDLIADLEPLTREAARRGAALVVWPEATVWVDPETNARVRHRLEHLSRELEVTLVVPFFLRAEAAGAALVVDSGRFVGTYGKQRPMWFLGERDAGAPDPAGPATSAGRLGTLLGVDTGDPASARRLVSSGAELLVSSTHDWQALAEQQTALSRLAAASLDVPLVRADWRHGSAIVDATGDAVADAGLKKRRTVVVGTVETEEGSTPYASLGDLFGWAALVLAMGLAVTRRGLGGQRAQAERPAQALAEPELPAHPAP